MRFANLFSILALIVVPSVKAASFDCSKASSQVERTICSSPQLSLLDNDLASAFKMAISSNANPDQVRISEGVWLKEKRNRCRTEACLVDAYKDRIEALVPNFWGTAGYDPCGHEPCENYAKEQGLNKEQALQLEREAGIADEGKHGNSKQFQRINPAANALKIFYSYHPLQLNTDWSHGVLLAEGNSANGYRIRMFSNNPPVEIGPDRIGPNVCPSGTATATATEDTRSRPPGYVTFGCWAPTQEGKLVALWEPYDKNRVRHFEVSLYDPSTFYMSADLALDLQRLAAHKGY